MSEERDFDTGTHLSLRQKAKEKLLATFIHLFISLVAVVCILILLYQFWFPSPLLGLGGIQGVKLVLLVDLVVGPICTFAVYNPRKKEIFWDMLVIALLQLSAMTYGLFMIYGQKPAYMVASYEGFYVVSRYEKRDYVDNKDHIVPVSLLSDTARYSGKIPILLLGQSENSDERGRRNFEYEFTNLIPEVFDTDNYDLISSSSEIFSERYEYSSEKRCYFVTISSAHNSIDTCVFALDDNKVANKK